MWLTNHFLYNWLQILGIQSVAMGCYAHFNGNGN